MGERDSFRKFVPTPAVIDRVIDRTRAEAELEPLRRDEALREEIRALREAGEVPPMVPEKGESVHARYTPKPMPAGTVPDEGAPKVVVAPLRADTSQMERVDLDKMRVPDGPRPEPADDARRDAPTDPKLVETGLVRRKKKYTPEQQAQARRDADELFAKHPPGSDKFMEGIALCHAFDLKLPDIDLDNVQALATEAVREALLAAYQKPPSEAPPSQHRPAPHDEAAADALPKRANKKAMLVGAAALLLVPLGIYLAVRKTGPDDTHPPDSVALQSAPSVLEHLSNAAPSSMPTLLSGPTSIPNDTAVETAKPAVSATAAASSKVSPPEATARPSASASASGSTTAASSSLAKPVW